MRDIDSKNKKERKRSKIMNKNFSVWLSQMLERRGWSQAELARRTGVSTATVSRLLSKTRHPSAIMCDRFGETLDIPYVTVYVNAGYMQRTDLRYQKNSQARVAEEMDEFIDGFVPSE